MTRPVQKVVPVVGLVVVGLLGFLDRERDVQAAPGPNEVLVVNSAASPARTTIQGPVTATIANGPAEPVPVALQGTPSVAVSGAVAIANTVAQPVPVRDVAPAPIPWIWQDQVIIEPGHTFGRTNFSSPLPGHRIVIEAVSVIGALPQGQSAIDAQVLMFTPGAAASFRMPMLSMPAESPTFDGFGVAMAAKLYVLNAGAIFVTRDLSAGTGVFDVALTGYLVPSE